MELSFIIWNFHSNLFLEVPFVAADTSPHNMSNRAVEKQTIHLRIGEDILLESDHDKMVTQFIIALNTSSL